MNQIRQVGTNRPDAYWVNFITGLSAEYVGRWPDESMDKDVLETTPTVIGYDLPVNQMLICNFGVSILFSAYHSITESSSPKSIPWKYGMKGC